MNPPTQTSDTTSLLMNQTFLAKKNSKTCHLIFVKSWKSCSGIKVYNPRIVIAAFIAS